MPAVSTPDSPTHTLRPAADLSNAPWMTAFHVACPQIQGQMLPEESGSHSKTYPPGYNAGHKETGRQYWMRSRCILPA